MSATMESTSDTEPEVEDLQQLEQLLNVPENILGDLASNEQFGVVLESVKHYIAERESKLKEYEVTLRDVGEQLASQSPPPGTNSA